MDVLPIPWVQPRDISAAVAWLASDESCYVRESRSRSTRARS
ncbi:hypothetical protein [Amycolatopsis benzoatilytica]|nr:hypothetical protein [Amycolatopsis benzoatilytica]